MGYYDLDSILSESERVICVTKYDALHLGYMCSQSLEGLGLASRKRNNQGKYKKTGEGEEEDDLDAVLETRVLKAETKVELPLWLAKCLSVRNLASIEPPRYLAKRFRISLLADPGSMDVRSRTPYFFAVGVSLSEFLPQQPYEELRWDLIAAFISRYQDMIDKAQNSRNEDVSKLTRPLTELEQKLFSAGYIASNEYYRWKDRKTTKLRAAYVVNKGMKRGVGHGISAHKRRRVSMT